MADGRIEIDTSINTKDAEKKLSILSQKIKNIGNSPTTKGLSNIGAAFSGLGAAVQLAKTAVSGAAATVIDLTETYKAQAQAETQLAVAAKNNPYLNYDSVQALKSFASEMQGIGTVGDEVLLPLMAQLAASGRTQAEIQDIIAASLDMSASGAMSLDGAVHALNKTFSGNAGLLAQQNGALKGLTEEQLKNGEAVKIIAGQYRGMMEETTRLTGGTQQLSNAWGDFKEIVGHGFNMILNPIAAKLAKIVSGINNVIAGAEKLDENASEDDKDRYLIRAAEAQYKEREELIESYRQEELRKAEAYAKKETEVLRRAKAESYAQLSDLDKSYLDQYRAEWERATQKVSEEIEKQEELKQTITDAKYRTETRENDAKRKAEEEEARRLAEEEAAAAVKARDELRAQYDETIRQKQEELRQRRINGEEISREAEAQEMYNTAFAAYIKMMSSQAFKGNSGNYEHEVSARRDIAGWAEIGGKEDLKKQITDFEEELRKVADEAKGIVKNQYDTILEALDAEYEAVIKNKYLEEEEKLRIEKEYAGKRQEITDARDKAEKEGFLAKIDALSSDDMDFVERYKARRAEIEDLQKELDGNSLLSAEELAAAQKKLDEELLQAKKEYASAMTAEVTGYASQAVSALQGAMSLMLDTVKNEAAAEQAELEKKYRNGEISEEEYQEKLTESKKQAAREQYKIQMVQWAASVLQATANIAQGVTQAIAQTGPMGLVTGGLVAAAGAVQIASIIASKPTPPNFSTGGIVGGSSFHGDNIAANLNSREMVMNQAQQKSLWEFINGGSNGAGGGTNIVINNSASNIASAQPRLSKDKIEIMIDARVNDSLKNGRYDNSLSTAEQGMSGDYYGI